MTYSIVVENRQGGYRATVMGWPDCIATGRTRAEALAQLRADLRQRLADVEIVSMDMDAEQQTHPMLQFAGVFKDDPLFDEVMDYWYELSPWDFAAGRLFRARME